MNAISANALKTKGISAIEQHLSKHHPEAIITVARPRKIRRHAYRTLSPLP